MEAPRLQPQRPPPRRRRRVFGWIIVGVNVLFLVLLILAVSGSSQCKGMTGDELSACQAGEGIGRGILFVLVLVVWALVDLILLTIFLVTRRRGE
jgi:hypothetical protein